MGTSVISKIVSEYTSEAMDGSAGRGMLMYFFLAIGILYLLISRSTIIID